MTYLLAALFTYRLTRLIVADSITEPIRNRILSRWPSDDTLFTDEWVTDTSGEPQTLSGAAVVWADVGWAPMKPSRWGELVTCAWCASVYVGALVVLGVVFLPGWFEYVMLAGAVSAITGLLSGWE